MDGTPHGIQMTPTGGGPKYLRTLCWQGTHQCSAFFCALRNLLICSLVRSLFQEERERVESLERMPLGLGNPGVFC